MFICDFHCCKNWCTYIRNWQKQLCLVKTSQLLHTLLHPEGLELQDCLMELRSVEVVLVKQSDWVWFWLKALVENKLVMFSFKMSSTVYSEGSCMLFLYCFCLLVNYFLYKCFLFLMLFLMQSNISSSSLSWRNVWYTSFRNIWFFFFLAVFC